jgi:hypothetical protein
MVYFVFALVLVDAEQTTYIITIVSEHPRQKKKHFIEIGNFTTDRDVRTYY